MESKSKNRLRTCAKIGSITLSLAGYGETAAVTRIATNVQSARLITSENIFTDESCTEIVKI